MSFCGLVDAGDVGSIPPPGIALPTAAPAGGPAAPSGGGGGGPPELTEAQKKLVEEDPAQTLDQQENMKISGSNARHMVMQKLMRRSEVIFLKK